MVLSFVVDTTVYTVGVIVIAVVIAFVFLLESKVVIWSSSLSVRRALKSKLVGVFEYPVVLIANIVVTKPKTKIFTGQRMWILDN